MDHAVFKDILNYTRKKTMSFSNFLDLLLENPKEMLHTSSTLIADAIKHFGFKIVIRSGEPMISYEIFKDQMNFKTNAVFGQEFCIKHIVDVIDSAGKEAGPNRGIILVGPPASGKTNIIDLIGQAVEEYTKQDKVKLYSFFFEFKSDDGNRTVEIWNSFRHNPILLFPTLLPGGIDAAIRPRQGLLEAINRIREDPVAFPTYYQTAALDKASLDIIEGLLENPRNRHKSLFEIYEEYVRIEEISFSNSQGRSISNIDDMRQLKVVSRPMDLGPEHRIILDGHLPGRRLKQYEGAIIDSNRGILHIHDAFGVDGNGIPTESEYKPLLMVLGSGRVSIASTQASIDNTIIMTTNLEEMKMLDRQLTSSKLLDRVEKIPVNYLLDANSEMDILKRDMANMREKYEVDPNLLRIAAYYAVMTRLLPPQRKKFPDNWSQDKRNLYNNITVEQKLFIYAYHAEDPVTTIKRLPGWHPFRNEAAKLGIDVSNPSSFKQIIESHPQTITLYESGLFSDRQLPHIDDEFMRDLWNEHYPNEGKHGISVRQLQNIMRNTIANSDGRRIHVGIFLSQLKKIIAEGPQLHHWLPIDPKFNRDRRPVQPRKIGETHFGAGEGDYGDFQGLVKVVKAIYFAIIRNEITVSVVDRDPEKIESDLRKYLQYVLLANALENRAFAHIMVPKYTFIHPVTGEKVDHPDEHFMESIESIIAKEHEPSLFRKKMAKKFLELQSANEIQLQGDKNVITSRGDNVLVCFGEAYGNLLSHRKPIEGVNPEILREAIFQKRNKPTLYRGYSDEIRSMVETILDNMVKRFRYPRSIALDTIIFALRKDIINFEEMIAD